MTYKILTYPDKNLRKKSLPVEVAQIKDQAMQDFLLQMTKIMIEKDGIGLAASQIGVLKRIIIIVFNDKIIILLNPVLSKKSWSKETDEEGCLSVPSVYGLVKRHQKIFVTAYNQEGEKIKFEASGLLARIIQHEVDHLDGVLFIDKLLKITHGKLENKNEQ